MGKNITIIKFSMHERHTKVNFSVVVLTFNLKVEDFENLSRLWAVILAGRRRELRACLNVGIWYPSIQLNVLNTRSKSNMAQNIYL